PSTAPASWDWCVYYHKGTGGGGGYVCDGAVPQVTKPGVYTSSTSFKNIWVPSGVTVDWSGGIDKLFMGPRFPGWTTNPNPDWSLYFPVTLRITVTLVPPGAVYSPPTGPAPPGSLCVPNTVPTCYSPPTATGSRADGGVDVRPIADSGQA